MFGKLFGKKGSKDDESKSRRKLSFGLKTTIFNTVGLRSVPPMPGAAQKAFQLATDPNAGARDFIDVIESDESLSARVMKISNSVYFDRGGGSKTIEDAVQVIGIQELRCLLNACSLTEIFPSRHSARQQIWANDVATGIAARSLARKLMPGKEDFAFLAGLMHDIGKLLLIQQAEVKYARVLTLVKQGSSFCEAEEEVFAFNHTEAGSLIGEKWKFDEDLIEAIQNHHLPIDVTETNKANLKVSHLVQIADLACHATGLGHPKGFGAMQNKASEDLAEIWVVTELSDEDLTRFKEELKESFDNEYDLYNPS